MSDRESGLSDGSDFINESQSLKASSLSTI